MLHLQHIFRHHARQDNRNEEIFENRKEQPPLQDCVQFHEQMSIPTLTLTLLSDD